MVILVVIFEKMLSMIVEEWSVALVGYRIYGKKECETKEFKLPDVHKLKLLFFASECRNHLPLKPFDDYFTPLLSLHDHNTGQAFRGDLFVPRISTTQYGKRTARYAGLILWNELALDLWNSSS